MSERSERGPSGPAPKVPGADVMSERSERDWRAWHAAYDAPESPLARRLAIVQGRIRDALDRAAPGPVRVVSVCAGEARDLLGALDGHPRAADVVGRLVELDPELAHTAAARAVSMGLTEIEVANTDASTTSAYAGAVPADLVLVCGVFGNIVDDDIANTVRQLPAFCAPGATVIWTRHRRPPDLTPTIRSWFLNAGFAEIAFDAPDDFLFTIGSFRYDGAPQTLVAGERLFTFVGYDQLLSS
jgi:hypothetical protein